MELFSLLLNYNIEVLITPELNFYALFRSGLGDEEYINKMTSWSKLAFDW